MTFIATADIALPTTITGSLPRPAWFTTNLQGRTFVTAFATDPTYREQYGDAVSALISDQSRAGLDIVSDGEMRFDQDIGGRSWGGYITDRVHGLAILPPTDHARPSAGGEASSNGVLRDRGIFDEIVKRGVGAVGELDAIDLQYDLIWKMAQRVTSKPVKMGSCSAQLLGSQVVDHFYKDRHALVTAFAKALNAEFHRLADAGCPVIQVEEPSLHQASGRTRELTREQYVEAFNVEVAGLRSKTEVWAHICWGNPFAQRLTQEPTLRSMLPYVDGLDADVVTFETAENGAAEIAEVAAAISKRKKIAIGVVRHRSLQVEQPEEVAALIRKALKYIEPERLVISSDCGFGRQGMPRVHAFYKMVALVKGTNIVRRELGLPEAASAASNPRFELSWG